MVTCVMSSPLTDFSSFFSTDRLRERHEGSRSPKKPPDPPYPPHPVSSASSLFMSFVEAIWTCERFE